METKKNLLFIYPNDTYSKIIVNMKELYHYFFVK